MLSRLFACRGKHIQSNWMKSVKRIVAKTTEFFRYCLRTFSVTLWGQATLMHWTNEWTQEKKFCSSFSFPFYLSFLFFFFTQLFFVVRALVFRLCVQCSGPRIYNSVGMNVCFMYLFFVSFSFIVIEARFCSVHTSHTHTHSVSKWKGIFTRRKPTTTTTATTLF